MVKLILCLGLILGVSFAQELKIGFLPYTNAIKLLQVHTPLREFLQQELQKDYPDIEVVILSSSSYEGIYKDAAEGKFDIIVTGPHFGALHIKEGFLPIARYKATLTPIFVVKKGSNYKTPTDLNGTQIALSNRLSVSTMGGKKWLEDSGMKEDVNFSVFEAPSHTTAIHSVVIGESAAAITTYTPIKQLAQYMQDTIRSFETPFSVPHLFTVADKNMDKEYAKKIKDTLFAFQNTKEGREYFKSTGYEGYVEITQKDLEEMEPYLEETLLLLKKYETQIQTN